MSRFFPSNSRVGRHLTQAKGSRIADPYCVECGERGGYHYPNCSKNTVAKANAEIERKRQEKLARRKAK